MSFSILIVDDHAGVRKALRSLLGATGLVVCGEAVNGLDAIEKAPELRPDLILLDLSMPVMSGLDAARELTKRMPKVPLILLTSHTDSGIHSRARAVGIRKVISKEHAHTRLVPEILEALI